MQIEIAFMGDIDKLRHSFWMVGSILEESIHWRELR